MERDISSIADSLKRIADAMEAAQVNLVNNIAPIPTAYRDDPALAVEKKLKA